MRFVKSILALGVVALALGTGLASARTSAALQCSTIGVRTLCFDAWGDYHQTTSASGNVITHDLFHRHFIEYTSGVLTFEQRDMIHRVVVTKAGEEHVSNDLFTGWSTPSGLVCKWREQLVVRDGEVLHSVDDFSCDSTN